MKKNLQRTFKKLIQILFKSIYGQILYLNNNNKKLQIEKKISKNKIFEGKKYFTYKIKKGIIYTDNVQHVAIISGNHLHGPSSFQHINDKLVKPRLNAVLKKGTPRIRKKFDGTVLSLAQGASGENYFHWLMDILPKLKICMENYNLNKINYFYLPALWNSQIESLGLLGIKKNKLINSKFNRHIIADEIISITHPWYTKGRVHDQANKMPKWIIVWIKNTFLKFKKKFQISKKIFLDRSDSKYQHCQIINYQEIKKYLKSKKFKYIKLSKLSFTKQIYLFWNANYIVGAHGAAFTNLVFCKPKTKIIEFRPFGHTGKNYKRISEINKLKYNSIVSSKKYLNNHEGDIYVPIKDLKKKLKK